MLKVNGDIRVKNTIISRVIKNIHIKTLTKQLGCFMKNLTGNSDVLSGIGMQAC